MKERKSLPKAFWVLIGLAGILGVVLGAAVILDSNPELQKKWNDWLNSKEKRTAEAPKARTPGEMHCDLIQTTELSPESKEGVQLQSTYQDGDVLAVEVFVSNPPRAGKIPILFNEKFAPQVSQAQDDSFFCDTTDAKICRQDAKAEVWNRAQSFESLYDGGGVLEYLKEAPAGEKGPVTDFVGVAKDPTGLRMIHNRLGICGSSLGEKTQFSSLRLHDRPWVAAFDPSKGVLAMFDVGSWSSFVPREVPKSADRQFAFINGQPNLFDCRRMIQGDSLDSITGLGSRLLVRVRGRQDLGTKMLVLDWNGENFSSPIWTSDSLKNWSGADEGGWAGPETLFVHMRDFTGEGQRLLLMSLANSAEVAKVDRASRSIVLSLPAYGASQAAKPTPAASPTAQVPHDLLVVEKESSWRTSAKLWLLKNEASGFKPLDLPTPDKFDLEENEARVRWMRLPGNRELLVWQGRKGGAVRGATYRCSTDG